VCDVQCVVWSHAWLAVHICAVCFHFSHAWLCDYTIRLGVLCCVLTPFVLLDSVFDYVVFVSLNVLGLDALLEAACAADIPQDLQPANLMRSHMRLALAGWLSVMLYVLSLAACRWARSIAFFD
jgi:hypothetical protein